MKMVKSLLLGSAAGVVAMAGAQAADLPVKAKPVQYVKICSLYGVGFYYVPGTDMCIKLGGWARFETGYGYNGSFTTEFYNANTQNRSTSDNNWRYKGVITVDARDQTPYGTVRSYVSLGTSNNNVGANAAGLYANRWFIQWAGFTIGHATSFYDFYSIGANQYGSITNGSDSGDGGWDVFAYTAQLGNGVSASISAEVQRYEYIERDNSGFAVARASNAVGTNYRGHDYPDLVGNIRVDQSWGSAQIMGALHNVSANYYLNGATGAVDESGGHPGDKLGFAVGGGLKLNAPMIGKGDYFMTEASYTQGALRYTDMKATVFDYAMYDGGTFGFGKNADAVFGGTIAGGTNTGLELTTAWSVNAAYVHYWNPQWRSKLWGSYREVSFTGAANAMLCSAVGDGNGARGTAAVANAGCNMDWSAWGLGLVTEWLVTKNFLFGLEVLYGELNSASTSTGSIALAAFGTKPANNYTIADQDVWAVRFRVNRSFYP